MKNIKLYTDHLRESQVAPQDKRSLDDIWVVYFQEEDEWHFVAAYDDPGDASARHIEEAAGWHGDAIIEDAMQQQMDQDPEEYGEGWTPSELYHRDPRAYKELWLWCLEFVQNHEEGEGRYYYFGRLKNVESAIESTGRGDNLKRFMKDLTESEETPEWIKDAVKRSQRSRGAFGRF
jgi:hypothetical protein